MCMNGRAGATANAESNGRRSRRFDEPVTLSSGACRPAPRKSFVRVADDDDDDDDARNAAAAHTPLRYDCY
ncbi:unnamed protein product [Merluccius merluccius]